MRKRFGPYLIYAIAFTLGMLATHQLFAEVTTSSLATFNGYRAFKHLEKQCDFGPRVAGFEGHKLAAAYIQEELRSLDIPVVVQTFEQYVALLGTTRKFQNIFGTLWPEKKHKIMLSAHWDTRPVADHDPDPTLRSQPIVGANDGASGVAVLLELARVLRQEPLDAGIIFAFFDAEDLGSASRLKDYCLGSRFLAANLPESLKFEWGINIDMVGDADLLFQKEGYSYQMARSLVDQFWQIGSEGYPSHFDQRVLSPILDDHYPFLERGYEYIDIIDFSYPYWHTHQDTADKCSPESLEVIGNTLLKFIKFKLQFNKKNLEN
jgi:glutaminyl-peptide cyclotransferase